MKKERDPTPEEFEKFLLWLDPDRDAAGRRLNLIQTRMIQISSREVASTRNLLQTKFAIGSP
jgi:hypothetical protein